MLIKEFDIQIPKILDESKKEVIRDKARSTLPTLGRPDTTHTDNAPSGINALEAIEVPKYIF